MSNPTAPVDRRKVRQGGLLGLAIGVLLLALALFFLVRGPDVPQEVLGVFLPLAVALVSLALGVAALVPLRWGDSAEHSPRVISRAWTALAVLGVVVGVAGVLRGELPWTLFVVVPLVVVVGLLRDGRRMAGAAAGSGAAGADGVRGTQP